MKHKLEQRWFRLAAAARRAAADEPAPELPPGFATRVAATWIAERRAVPAAPMWAAFAVPGLGVALLVAILAVVTVSPSNPRADASEELVALADPLTDPSVLP